ncbi:MAG: family 16 glycosylhydrolase [Bacteroidetes bacterium]|nr:family 16 glycosylhydrolase [Bacteroidota bacterium]
MQNSRSWKYTSGKLESKRRFLYGKFEIRFRTPEGKGFWPAFWLYSLDSRDEIDIFEMEGAHPYEIHLAQHAQKDLGKRESESKIYNFWFDPSHRLQGSFSEQFNTITMIWDQQSCDWYLNDKYLHSFSRSYEDSMRIIVNLAISSGVVFDGPPNKNTGFPASFEIDYIKVWEDSTKGAIDQSIEIIPNPVASFATIKLNKKLPGKMDIVVSDINGKMVICESNVSYHFSLDLSSLTDGLYIVTFLGSDRVVSSKLVIAR